MACQALDDLFQWASQQAAGYTNTVKLAMTTNDATKHNLVSYSEGILSYSNGGAFGLPSFSSGSDQVIQFFSDRRTGGVVNPLLGGPCPFDCASTDPLTVTITPSRGIQTVFHGPPVPPYFVFVKSSKWAFELTFGVNCDPSGIVYGVFNSTFFTLSFCGKRSEQPNK
jgi:hypothetical protein